MHISVDGSFPYICRIWNLVSILEEDNFSWFVDVPALNFVQKGKECPANEHIPLKAFQTDCLKCRLPFRKKDHGFGCPKFSRLIIFHSGLLRDAPKKKKRDFLGIFPKCRPPPPLPPFWEPLFPKKKCGLFCILGHLEHFWSSQKCSLFGNYSDIYFWE